METNFLEEIAAFTLRVEESLLLGSFKQQI
jgi:hypothetical protein